MRTFIFVAALIVAVPARGEEKLKDYTGIKVEQVKPAKDPKTGFMVGGKNDTAAIRKLTSINGKSIAELEKAMRPKALSTAGFLGKDERLLDVMAMDNKTVVDEMGLTHREIARHLLAVEAALRSADGAGKKEPGPFLYHGRKFKARLIMWRGYQHSPFEDGTKTNSDIVLENVATGKKLGYSCLVPLMIGRYGFYEGKGTSFRVDPAKVVEVFDFLKKKD
jgi:hypothetical protein